MRILLFILVCVIAFGAGWHFHPDIKKQMDARIAARKEESQKEKDGIRNEVAGEVRAKSGGSAAEILAAIREGKKYQEPASTNASSAEASTAASTTPAGEPAAGTDMAATTPAAPAAPVDPVDARYPLPVFKEITEITKEWSSIPSKAFPRPVKTKVAVTFENEGKKSTLPENSDARAVGMVQGMLILMPKGDDNSRAMIPLANTDLKETLTALYEKYKAYKTSQIMAQRLRAKGLLAKGPVQDAATGAAGPKPERQADGVIQAMVDDLGTRKLKEISVKAITEWGDLNYEEVTDAKGLPPGFYWTGTVAVTVENPLFGPQPAECMAVIKNGKVLTWLYTGSREEVQ